MIATFAIAQVRAGSVGVFSTTFGIARTRVVQYSWSQRRRLSVRPGMTGLWQVSGRNNIGFEEWVEMDLDYIDRWSIWLDIKILFMTFRAVVAGRGAS